MNTRPLKQLAARPAGFPGGGGVEARRKCLIAFLAVIAALFALVAAWRWTPLQDWLSLQRVAEFIT
jgi:hypothetical protein